MGVEWERRHPIDDLTASSPRLRDFRTRIETIIPTPKGREADKDDLRRMPLATLLATYANWADRFIRPRKRQVMVWNGFWLRNDPKQFAAAIDAIIALSHEGGDLTPYLSGKVHSEGYVP